MAVPAAGRRKSRLKAVPVPSRLARKSAATAGASSTGDAKGDMTSADHIELSGRRCQRTAEAKHGRSADRAGTHRTGGRPRHNQLASGPPAQSRQGVCAVELVKQAGPRTATVAL